jgi:glutaredoxin
MSKKVTLYRMVNSQHICPFGLKAKDLLRRHGFKVDDCLLASRDATDVFKEQYGVKTTPQIFIDDERIGGYDDLRLYLGLPVADNNKVTYRPVITIFVVSFFNGA